MCRLLAAIDIAYVALTDYPRANAHPHRHGMSGLSRRVLLWRRSLMPGVHTAGPVLVVVVPNTYEPSTSAVCSLMWEPYGGSLRLCYFGTTTT